MKRTALLLLPVMLLFLAAPAALADTSTTTIPLEYSGYDLVPGYVYSVSFEMDWTRLPGWVYADEAEFVAGPMRIDIMPAATLGGMGFKLTVYIDGVKKWSKTDTWDIDFGGKGTKEYHFTIDIDCKGQGRLIYADDNKVVAGFILQDATPIYTWGDGHADIVTTKSYGCNGGGGSTATLPPGPGGPGRSVLSGLAHGLSTATVVGFTLVMLGLAGLIILIAFKQAKRHKLVQSSALALLLLGSIVLGVLVLGAAATMNHLSIPGAPTSRYTTTVITTDNTVITTSVPITPPGSTSSSGGGTGNPTTTTTTTSSGPLAKTTVYGYIDCGVGVPHLIAKYNVAEKTLTADVEYATERLSTSLSSSLVMKVYDSDGSFIGETQMEWDPSTSTYLGDLVLQICGYHELTVEVWQG